MPVAVAYVNHGRWVADCPFGCGGAELAREEWFICRECLNYGCAGARLALVWPAEEDIGAIEAALVVRPLIHRNWDPIESLGFLLAENVAHGLFDTITGEVAGDIGADQRRFPALASLQRLELTA